MTFKKPPSEYALTKPLARQKERQTSTYSTTTVFLSRGINVQLAVLKPIGSLVADNIFVYFLAELIASLGDLLYTYFLFYYYGLDIVNMVCVLRNIGSFFIEAIPKAINHSAAELVGQFLQAGQVNAASAVFTYGLFISFVVLVALVIVLEIVTPYIAPLVCVSDVAKEACQYCYLVCGLGGFIKLFSAQLIPYYRVESKQLLELGTRSCDYIGRLLVLLLGQLFSSKQNEKGIRFILASELTGSLLASLLSLALHFSAFFRLYRRYWYSKFSLKYLSPFRLKLLVEVLKSTPASLMYQQRFTVLVLTAEVLQIASQRFSFFCKNNMLFMAYYEHIRQISSSFLTASEPVFSAIGSINTAVKRTDRVTILLKSGLAVVWAMSFAIAFAMCVLATPIRKWLYLAREGILNARCSAEHQNTQFTASQFLRLASLDGILCAPMQVCYNTSFFKQEAWKLVVYLTLHYSAAALVLLVLALENKINQPAQLLLFLPTIATIMYQIPTFVALLRPPRPQQRVAPIPEPRLDPGDSLSFSTRCDSPHEERLSDIEPVNDIDQPRLPYLKDSAENDAWALEFVEPEEENY